MRCIAAGLVSMLLLPSFGCCTTSQFGDAKLDCCDAFIGYKNEKDCSLYLPDVSLKQRGMHRFRIDNLPDLFTTYWVVERRGDTNGAGFDMTFQNSAGETIGTLRLPPTAVENWFQPNASGLEILELPGDLQDKFRKIRSMTIDVSVTSTSVGGSIRLTALGYIGVPQRLLSKSTGAKPIWADLAGKYGKTRLCGIDGFRRVTIPA